MSQGVSARRASYICFLSSGQLYRQARPDRNEGLRKRLLEVARPGAGYRQLWAMLRQEFAPLNIKRVYRLYRQMNLARQVKYRKKRSGTPLVQRATGPNQVWCLDFCHDWAMNGTKLKILAIKDEFTKECLSLEVATSITGRKVRDVLSNAIALYGPPAYLRSDNGPEFISRVLALYLSEAGVKSQFITPGSPWQNGHAESFMSRLRAECLNAEVFANLADAQLKLHLYQRFYNCERAHSALNYTTPESKCSRFLNLGRATPSLNPRNLLTSKENSI